MKGSKSQSLRDRMTEAELNLHDHGAALYAVGCGDRQGARIAPEPQGREEWGRYCEARAVAAGGADREEGGVQGQLSSAAEG